MLEQPDSRKRQSNQSDQGTLSSLAALHYYFPEFCAVCLCVCKARKHNFKITCIITDHLIGDVLDAFCQQTADIFLPVLLKPAQLCMSGALKATKSGSLTERNNQGVFLIQHFLDDSFLSQVQTKSATTSTSGKLWQPFFPVFLNSRSHPDRLNRVLRFKLRPLWNMWY